MRVGATNPGKPSTTPESKAASTDYKTPDSDRPKQAFFKLMSKGGSVLTLNFNGKEKMTKVLEFLNGELNLPAGKTATIYMSNKRVVGDQEQYHHLTAAGEQNLVLALDVDEMHQANKNGPDAAQYFVLIRDN